MSDDKTSAVSPDETPADLPASPQADTPESDEDVLAHAAGDADDDNPCGFNVCGLNVDS